MPRSERQPTKSVTLRFPADLHEAIRKTAGSSMSSMNKWVQRACRKQLEQEISDDDFALPEKEIDWQDAQDKIETQWNHALNRRLRNPGKWRDILNHLAVFWNLPRIK
jgi:hypothetical protein